MYSIAGKLQAALHITRTGSGTVEWADWSPTGNQLVCWCSEPPALNVFDTAHWGQVASVDFQGFTQLTQGLIYGLRYLMHVSLASSLSEQEAVSLCRLSRVGEEIVFSGPDALPFFLPHATSAVHSNQQPAFQGTLPSFSLDGSFLAVIDRSFKLHVITCKSGAVVFQRQVHLPPSSALPQDRTDTLAQLSWVNSGTAILVVLTIEDVDPPLAASISLFEFDL